MASFTTQIPNLQQAGPLLQIKIDVPQALKESKAIQPEPQPVTTQAMIDTGATGTVIQAELIESLGLKPVGVVSVSTPSSTNVMCNQYFVKLLLPNNVTVDAVIIAAPLKDQHIQCLIGRDILQHGVFIYTGYINQFTLSF
jgi:predicted aspartyl protease